MLLRALFFCTLISSLCTATTTSEHTLELKDAPWPSIQYLTYLPEDYETAGSKKWALLIFLHGAGERW